MSTKYKKCIPMALLLSIGTTTAQADGEFPEFDIQGFIDTRISHSSDQKSFFEGGLGKTRYGADEVGNGQTRTNLAEASLLVKTKFSWSLSSFVHLKFDPEQKNNIDVVEAFLTYKPLSTSAIKFKARVGTFFPPMTLENTDIAWTSPYSITSSAINSWIGEEIKPTGVEFTLDYSNDDHEVSVFASAFMLNDPAGVLLAWRGWAFNDSKSSLFGRIALPNLKAIGPDGAFVEQAPYVQGGTELDDRVGLYGGFDWDYQGLVRINALYYTNRGDPESLDGKQYAWETEFLNVGLSLNLIEDLEIFGQIMKGNTKMGPFPGGGERRAVDVDFDSFYIMTSKTFGPHRISARFDDFSTTDLAFVVPIDLNNENGHSWMVSYSVELFKTHRLSLEVLQVISDRENRVDFGLDTYQKEHQLQASYRITF